MLELGIAIRVVVPLFGLAVGLEAISQIAQQPADGLMAQVMPQVSQGVGQISRALAGPEQRGHGIAAGGRIDEPLEVAEQGPIGRRDRVAPAPGSANPRMIRRGVTGAVVTGLDLGDAAADRRRDGAVATATAEMPPRPKARASQAAQHRRAFS